ncbi:sensor histidine kinase [Pedobacter aquatilis]|uniref:sensor histidine kinase n=1 Tax=Pedobacter aquatilis TaxID=351343 RepID=UPI00292F49BB|nr:histidine kinase [Pedobacter aquatilis]
MIRLNSWFWPLQLLFWLLIGGVNFCAQYFYSGFDFALAVLNFTGLSFGGLISSTLYRNYYRRNKLDYKIPWPRLILHVLGSALLQSLLWLLIMVLLSWPFTKSYAINLGKVLINLAPIYILVLAWDLVYLGYHLIRTYHRAEVEKWRLESEFQKAKLGALKAQVNPHFMFNAINNIRALILENPVLAREMLTRFAEIFRHALQYTGEKLITINEELGILTHYLEIQQLQFDGRLRYVIDAQEHLLMETIPPLILQLLVENAIKHGISLNENGGEILIGIGEHDNILQLEVKNTGTLALRAGLEEHMGIGLKNIAERLSLTYGAAANLEITEQASFVVVTIKIMR